MAGASRRGYGEDGVYFDHRADCRDSTHQKTCSGRWRGVVSLGFDADGKRIRKKVSGKTRTEVKDKLKSLHSELDAGVRSTAAYTVEKAVTDWLAEGLPGRTAKTVEVNRDSLRPLLAVIGTIPLRDLTVQDVRTALRKMAGTHATRTLQKAHNCLTRALRHAEGQDLVRRNVSALVDTPGGREGRPSQSLTLAEATVLLEAAEESRALSSTSAGPVSRNTCTKLRGENVSMRWKRGLSIRRARTRWPLSRSRRDTNAAKLIRTSPGRRTRTRAHADVRSLQYVLSALSPQALGAGFRQQALLVLGGESPRP